MTVKYSIISIGTLANNLCWKEQAPVRTAHATTVLVETENRRILVDPSLPGKLLDGKFFERTGKHLDYVTDVFCTTLRPDVRRALSDSLSHANWYASETELQWYFHHLESLKGSLERLDEDGLEHLDRERETIRQFKEAPEKFSPQVSIYPLAGPTPGCTGLLLTPPESTILIAGPAAVTSDYIETGMIWQECMDKDQSMESLTDILEIADVIVPGYDNTFYRPQRWI